MAAKIKVSPLLNRVHHSRKPFSWFPPSVFSLQDKRHAVTEDLTNAQAIYMLLYPPLHHLKSGYKEEHRLCCSSVQEGHFLQLN